MPIRRMRYLAMVAALALAAPAAARTVEVTVPAEPAVDIDARVAVVTGDHDCAAIAGALIDELHAIGVTVDPRATVRLQVSGCEQPVRHQVDVEIAQNVRRRRDTVEGRAHALVDVSVDGLVQAHLIGASATAITGSWNASDGAWLSRTAERALVAGVATDLADQVRPMPRIVERHVYPGAAEGTARALHNQAVSAERAGDLAEARRLAALAFARRPNPASAAYMTELQRRDARTASTE
jgi:hypothetical protein